jgi:predicted membrane-bound mannosyltransferase
MNGDGLYIKYGTAEGSSAHKAGEYRTHVSGEQVIEITVDAKALTAAETILSDVLFIPANAHVTWVETVAVVPLATGTAIDLGLIARDRVTEVDYDGLLAAFPTAQASSVGETIRFTQEATTPATQTGTGALVGEEITTVGGAYVSASTTTATAFTAGKLKVRIGYVPRGVDNP